MKNLFTELSTKNLKNKCGIYIIKCKEHLYVGSSKSLWSRLYEHRYDMKNAIHSNPYIQKCFLKYGEQEIFFDILEYCTSDIRIEREAYYIEKLKTTMNLQDPVTKILSKESREKISKSLKESYIKGKHKKPDKKPVEMYDLHGNYIKDFTNCEEAAKELGVSTHHIQVTASKYYEGRVCGIKRFRYKDSKVSPQKFSFVRPQVVTKYFDLFIVEPTGEEVSIKKGIKNINQMLVDQLIKGKKEIVIRAKPIRSE
jgi:hypothetical protein